MQVCITLLRLICVLLCVRSPVQSSSDLLPVSLYYRNDTSNPCTLNSIKLVNTNEIVELSEVSGRLFSAQAFTSNSSNLTCNYQEKKHNASRIVAISIHQNLINGLIAFENASYQAHMTKISEASGELIQLEAKFNLTNHLGGACGVNTTGYKTSLTESTSSIKLNYVNASIHNYYMELYLVIDNAFYRKHSGNYMNYIMEMVNYVNAIYRAQGIHIVVVGMNVWSDYNRITLSSNYIDNILNLAEYQIKMSTHHDVLHMINGISYGGETIGIAFINSLCQFGYSVGMSTDYGSSSSLYTAMIMAHELGHNLGLDHDTKGCTCSPDDTCVMNTYVSRSARLVRWSDCSLKQMHANLKSGASSYCMNNIPQEGADWSDSNELCGNAIVDAGEDCDVGFENSNNCCDMNSCTFFAEAKCASGACCDKSTCQILSQSVMCRASTDECDKEEYCTGLSEDCPNDSFYENGTYCDNFQGTCYDGKCGSQDRQCKWLFGSNSYSASKYCYELNLLGRLPYGFCDYTLQYINYEGSLIYSTYACSNDDYLCGTLHCQGGYQEIWLNLLTYYYNYTDDAGKICSHLVRKVDLSGLRDPGMVPNGAICGDNKICINSKCEMNTFFGQNSTIPESVTTTPKSMATTPKSITKTPKSITKKPKSITKTPKSMTTSTKRSNNFVNEAVSKNICATWLYFPFLLHAVLLFL